MLSLSVEVLAEVAGEGGGQGTRLLRVDLLDNLVVRLPPEVLQVHLGVLHQPEQVGGEVAGGGEVPGLDVGVRGQVGGVVTTSVHHRHRPRLRIFSRIFQS